MNIVLAGDYGTKNLGDQGMLAVLREHLSARHRPEITVLSRHPSPDYERAYRVATLLDVRGDLAAGGPGAWFHGFNRGDSRDHLEPIAEAIRAADLLVLGGGRSFFDHRTSFMRGDLAAHALYATLARFVGTPVMLFAMSVVSETSQTAREHLRFLAEVADVVTVRELQSQERLAELGVDRARVQVLPDPTLGLPYLEREESYGLRSGADWMADAERLLTALEVERQRPVLGLNVRSYAWRDGADGQRRTEAGLAHLLDAVVRAAGCQVLFIPQRTYADASGGRSEDDDRSMSRRVRAAMAERASARCIEEELSIWQALAVYRRAAAVLSMRRHGLTFALTQRVPVVSIAMDENTDHLMSSLGLSASSVTLAPGRTERSVRTVQAALATSPEARSNLFGHVQECAERTRLYARLISDLVDRRGA